MADVVAELARGRESYAAQNWTEAHTALSAADQSESLSADDLELLATSAYMLGREDEYLELLERAHAAHLQEDDPGRAVRCALWVGTHFAQRGDIARAGGWLGRAHRLLERHHLDELERGYLLLPAIFDSLGAGRPQEAARVAGEAVAIAELAADRELFALAAHMEGHIKIELGDLDSGLALLDEAMLPAAAGELSPIVTGIVDCGVILACQEAHEVSRAREWTGVLSKWCESQPDLVAFTGRCRIHRAEIMQLGGSWTDALDEARRAHQRCLEGQNDFAAGEASYRQAEIHRLRGEHTAAERAYREASSRGREPQPGLALLRLAQGDGDAALASIRRALAEADQPSKRVALVPACVEIMVAADRVDEARTRSGGARALRRRRGQSRAGGYPRSLAGGGRARGGRPRRGAALAPRRGAAPGTGSRRRTRSRERGSLRAWPVAGSATRRALRSSWRPRGSPTPSSAPPPTSCVSMPFRRARRVATFTG